MPFDSLPTTERLLLKFHRFINANRKLVKLKSLVKMPAKLYYSIVEDFFAGEQTIPIGPQDIPKVASHLSAAFTIARKVLRHKDKVLGAFSFCPFGQEEAAALVDQVMGYDLIEDEEEQVVFSDGAKQGYAALAKEANRHEVFAEDVTGDQLMALAKGELEKPLQLLPRKAKYAGIFFRLMVDGGMLPNAWRELASRQVLRADGQHPSGLSMASGASERISSPNENDAPLVKAIQYVTARIEGKPRW